MSDYELIESPDCISESGEHDIEWLDDDSLFMLQCTICFERFMLMSETVAKKAGLMMKGKNKIHKFEQLTKTKGVTMQVYIGTKQIQAEPMLYEDWAEEKGIDPKKEPPGTEGYKVIYRDDYISWSPRVAFEDAYRKSGEMGFGEALYVLKNGVPVRLNQWNKDVYITMQSPDENSKMSHQYLYVTSRFGTVPWMPTQVELFSNEWGVFKGEPTE